MRTLLTTTVLSLTLLATPVLAKEHHGGHHGGKHQFMKEMLSDLPEDQREQFKSTMEAAKTKNEALREKKKALYEKKHAILVAPDFDKKAFIDVSEELHNLKGEMHRNKSEAKAEALSKLPQETRQKMADRMKQFHEKMKARFEKRKEDKE